MLNIENTTIRCDRSAAAAAAALAASLATCPHPVRADVQATLHMTSPQLEARLASAPPQYRAALDRAMTMSIYATSKKSRVDTATMSVVTDSASGKVTLVDPTAGSYYTDSYDAMRASGMLSPGSMTMPGGVTLQGFHVARGSATRTILGHVCREYVLTGTMVLPGNAGTGAVKDDMFVAADVPAVHAGTTLGPFASMASRVHGFPLYSTTTVSRGTEVGVTMTMEVDAVSTAPVPAYAFVVPAGYTRAPSRAAFIAAAARNILGGTPADGAAGSAEPSAAGQPGQP